MFVTVSQSELHKGLGLAGRAVSPRSALPITGHLLLATRPGKLKLAATNIDLAITTLIDADVREEGSLSVPARLFSDLIASLPDGEVELRRKQASDMVVRAPRFDSTVKGLPAEEFPAIDANDAAILYRVPALALRQAIDDVIFAAAKDTTRPQLSGLLLRAKGAELTMVGCDGFRLSVRTLRLAAPVADDTPELIVPRTTMAEVARGFGALDEPVAIAATPTRAQVAFAASSLQMVSRVVDGAYVEFQRVLDQVQRHDVTITALAADVQRASRFSAIVSRDANHKLQIDAAPGQPDGALVFQATATQVGENLTEVAARIDGPAAKLAIDNTYLADVLGAIRTERMTITAASGQTLPVLVRPEGGEDAQHLIMPMHSK